MYIYYGTNCGKLDVIFQALKSAAISGIPASLQPASIICLWVTGDLDASE